MTRAARSGVLIRVGCWAEGGGDIGESGRRGGEGRGEIDKDKYRTYLNERPSNDRTGAPYKSLSNPTVGCHISASLDSL